MSTYSNTVLSIENHCLLIIIINHRWFWTIGSARHKSRSICDEAGGRAALILFSEVECGGQTSENVSGIRSRASSFVSLSNDGGSDSGSGEYGPAAKSSMVRFQNHCSRQSSAKGCWSQSSLFTKSSGRVRRKGRSPWPQMQIALRQLPDLIVSDTSISVNISWVIQMQRLSDDH